jgi:hypothetical protein
VLPLLLAALAIPPTPLSDPLDRPLPPALASARLDEVLREVERTRDSHPVVVLDIDQTLVDHGIAIPGAVEFVRELVRRGATLVYVSGRYRGDLLATRAQLERLGFPIRGPHKILLNPRADLQKVLEFKRSVRPRVLALGHPVALFDNEKANARLFRRQYPGAHVFRLRTRAFWIDHGGPSQGISVIDNFVRGRRVR